MLRMATGYKFIAFDRVPIVPGLNETEQVTGTACRTVTVFPLGVVVTPLRAGVH